MKDMLKNVKDTYYHDDVMRILQLVRHLGVKSTSSEKMKTFKSKDQHSTMEKYEKVPEGENFCTLCQSWYKDKGNCPDCRRKSLHKKVCLDCKKNHDEESCPKCGSKKFFVLYRKGNETAFVLEE